MHDPSLLALSILCIPPSFIPTTSLCVHGGRKTGTSADSLHLEGTRAEA